jgi:hypothetical protein
VPQTPDAVQLGNRFGRPLYELIHKNLLRVVATNGYTDVDWFFIHIHGRDGRIALNGLEMHRLCSTVKNVLAHGINPTSIAPLQARNENALLYTACDQNNEGNDCQVDNAGEQVGLKELKVGRGQLLHTREELGVLDEEGD